MKGPPDDALSWLRLPGRSESFAPFRAFVLENARGAGLCEAVEALVDLVLEEVLVNVFCYAFEREEAGMVAVGCGRVAGKGFLVRVADPGRPFDPLGQPLPDVSAAPAERTVGGLGIFLARTMSSDLAYCRREGLNILDIYFRAA